MVPFGIGEVSVIGIAGFRPVRLHQTFSNTLYVPWHTPTFTPTRETILIELPDAVQLWPRLGSCCDTMRAAEMSAPRRYDNLREQKAVVVK